MRSPAVALRVSPRALIWAAPLTLIWAPAAWAQTFQGPTVSDVGLPAVSVSLDTLFDSNVARSNATEAAARGLKLSDTKYSPNVSVDLTRPIGAESVFLRGDIGYDFYQSNTILNRERIDLQAGGRASFGLCQATLTGGVNRHQSYLEDIDIAAPLVRNTQTVTSVSLDTGCSRPIGFTPFASVSQSWQDDSTPQFRQFDDRQLTVSGGIAYQQPTLGKLSGFIQYNRTDYPNQIPLGALVPGNHYDLYAGGLRFERDLGARISATASVAYTSLATVGSPGFSGLTYSGDVSYRFSGRLSAHLAASRAARPATLNAAAFLVDNNYSAELMYGASSRLSATLGVSEDQQNYGGAVLAPAIQISNQRMDAIYATTRLDFGRRFYVGLNARYEVRRSDVIALNYNSARVGVSLGAHF
ncbi:MAG TPA: hypothetical protein VGI95_08890 [Caulobacteraceae bacterium]|jgi:hypothetical protein